MGSQRENHLSPSELIINMNDSSQDSEQLVAVEAEAAWMTISQGWCTWDSHTG